MILKQLKFFSNNLLSRGGIFAQTILPSVDKSHCFDLHSVIVHLSTIGGRKSYARVPAPLNSVLRDREREREVALIT